MRNIDRRDFAKSRRLRPAEAAEYLGITPRQLQRWRSDGVGPRYFREHSAVYDTRDWTRS